MARNVCRTFTTFARLLSKMNFNSLDLPEIFLPPTNRSMQRLDKSFFQKHISLAAVRIFDLKNVSLIRGQLTKSGEILQISQIKPLRDDEVVPGTKCILLKPELKSTDPSTWSPSLSKLVNDKIVQVRPFDLNLTYDDWTMHNILEAILPELPEDEKETPAGFAQVGHVAHLNLRAPYLPYKTLIGQILLDKNPTIRTVINKTLDVGTESVFRTFPYEVLAGPDDLDVTVNESGCEFKFNFGKVYWNPRLGTEHGRLIDKFKEGEAICDVMAGVGPFSVPAGKKRIFVHANDLNPDSFDGLQHAIAKNKVENYVSASCLDGRAFIREATKKLPTTRRTVKLGPKPKISRNSSQEEKIKLLAQAEAQSRVLEEPASFDHYVMNLPATAVEFLDAFRGIYEGREAEFSPHTNRKLPMVHVYMFQAKLATEAEEFDAACKTVSKYLGAQISLNNPADELDIYYVRLVAPKKKMFCVSFRLPAAVAFGTMQS